MPAKHSKADCPFISDITLLQSEINHMKKSQDELKDIVEKGFKELKAQINAQSEYNERTYVRRDEFSLIQKIVYGGLGALLLAALGFALKAVYGW